MYQLIWTGSARTQYDNLKNARGKKAAGLFKQVAKALQYLQSNPRHPGLHTHQFKSLESPYDSRGKVWEAYAQNRTPNAYRIFFCYGPERNQITIIAITPHP